MWLWLCLSLLSVRGYAFTTHALTMLVLQRGHHHVPPLLVPPRHQAGLQHAAFFNDLEGAHGPTLPHTTHSEILNRIIAVLQILRAKNS